MGKRESFRTGRRHGGPMVVNKNPARFWLTVTVGLLLSACQQQPPIRHTPSDAADLVFVGENILTMDPQIPQANAVAVRGDTIVEVGDRDSVLHLIAPDTKVIELDDKALIPGLIDAHGHFAFTARLLQFVNLSSPPVGTATSIDDVVDMLAKRIAQDNIPPGTWVMGFGYDDSLLAEQRHPTRDDLDGVSTQHPVGIMHVSAHLAVANSLALKKVGIDANSENPPGGVIRRQADGRTPNGVLEESAAYAVIVPMAMGDSGALENQIRDAALYYASFGITTVTRRCG